MRRTRVALLFAAASLLLTAQAAIPATATDWTADGVPQFNHVFLIVGENTSLSQITANNAPYQVRKLEPDAAWFTNYWASSHYSTSNYVAMTSGQYIRCEQDDVKPIDCHQSVENLFHQLTVGGVSWKAWNESMPTDGYGPNTGGCYLLNAGADKTGNAYRPKHNPAEYYTNIVGDYTFYTTGILPSQTCRDNVVSTGTTGFNDMSSFHAALKNHTAPQFNYITPNMCEDGHDNCKPAGNTITQFDTFLANEVQVITTAYPDALVIVVYDEGQGGGANYGSKFGGGNVLLAVMGSGVLPGTYADLLNHYSLLRTLEDGYRTTDPITGEHYAGFASTATPIGKIWSGP